MHEVAAVVKGLLIFVGALVVMLVVLIVLVSRLAPGNPLKRLLTAVAFRVGATLAAGLLAIPIEPIPGLDLAYDIGIPALLLLYWLSLLKRPRKAASRSTWRS